MDFADKVSRGCGFRKFLFVCSLFLILYIPFASKPVHIDDANFLMLAEGAARDPWRPHNILVNWSGKTEPAFDILANPPGIAWYLASVRNSPEWMLHLTMLPWLVLGGWGCWLLGSEFANGAGYLSCMYILTCPVVVISAHALTPDLPVFACMTAGIAGFLAFPRFQWAFALLAGGAALFRYSGCTAIPLLVLAGWTRYGSRGARMALISAIPILLLVLHDIHAYGKIHLFVMFASQNDGQKKTFSDAMHICVAGIAMLGGAGVLPVLIWRSETIVGVVVGAILGFNVAWLSGLNLVQTVPTVLSISAGVGALTLSIVPRVRDPILSAWALGGTAFFYFVAFAATRYWAAFIPGVALLAIRNAQHSQRWIMAGIAINTVVSFGIAVDDQQFAFAHKDAAGKVAAMGIGTFSGHWGWQHYLDKAGWTPVERGGNPGPLHAFASFGDSQLPDATACLELIERFPMPDRWPGPRSYSWRNRAFYHGGGRGSYAPWTFSNEPYDVISVYRRCDPKSEQINALEAEE